MSSGTPACRAGARRDHINPVPLRVAGATGCIGSLCVLAGVSQRGSPFASKLPDAWFFGLGHGVAGAGDRGTFLGVVAVYLGVVLMIGSWCEVVRTLRRRPGGSVKELLAVMSAWAAPVIVMPPLFSRDVYTYAAQGEMVSRGINPYTHGPTALGSNPYLTLVDPIWRRAHAPYGPAWERLAGGIVRLAGHDVIATIVGFRLVALLGLGLIAWGVSSLARSLGRDPATALALGVLNPLVLLVLLGGAHNDALMLGLLVAGCATARRGHVGIALVLCALAAEVKVPALIGALCIGWWWGDGGVAWRRRATNVGQSLLMVIALMVVIGLACGLGWRWLNGLSDPGVVVSWADPMTAVGLAFSHATGALGLGHHALVFIQIARAFGLGLAACISVGLVLRDEADTVQALGWSLLAFVILGPIVWPWYETWGFVFLAVVAESWTLRLLLSLSAIACFADVPGIRYYQSADPTLAVICWTLLIGGVAAYGAIRLLPTLRPDHRTELSAIRSR